MSTTNPLFAIRQLLWAKRILSQPPTLPTNYAATPVMLNEAGRIVSRPPNPQAVLERRGYLPQQRQGDYDIINSARAYAVQDPIGAHYYDTNQLTRLREVARGFLGDKINPRSPMPSLAFPSEDAWAMYLGLPQQHKTFEVSPYQPSISRDPNKVYLRMPSLWSAMARNQVLLVNKEGELIVTEGPTSPHPGGSSPGLVGSILNILGDSNRAILSGDILSATTLGAQQIEPGVALGNFTVGKGEDNLGTYISMYDKWDLDIPGAGTRVGRAFEIYDRLYYDPKTLMPLNPQPQPTRRVPTPRRQAQP